MQQFIMLTKVLFVLFVSFVGYSSASNTTNRFAPTNTNSTNENRIHDIDINRRKNSSSHDNKENNNHHEENGGGVGVFNIGDLTLEEICQMFSHPLENCTCDNPEVEEICRMVENRGKVIKIYLPPKSLKYDRIQGSLIIVASVFGLIGNSLVILVTINNWKNNNYCHKLIGVLAMSDIFFAILQFIEAIPKLWTHKWLYGLVMCKAITGVYNLSSWVSMGLILVIAIERYNAIVRPYSNGIHALKLYYMIGILILVGIALIIPMMLHITILGSGRCSEEWDDNQQGSLIYSWVLMFIGFLIPLFVICVLYGQIVLVLWKASHSHALNDQQQKARMQANKRIMAIVITVFVSFVVLVFPIRIIWLLTDHHVLEKLDRDTIDALIVFGLVPYSFHVAVNPIIYSAIDRKFRDGLKDLFKKRFSGGVGSKYELSSTETKSSLDNSRKDSTAC